MKTLIRHLRRLALGAGITDGQLLDEFVERREEAAFATLVQRHGPMVFGVCRRLLGNQHDAEDAFQATFLVLVRKAGRIRGGDTIGNWLYGVACRTALRARAMNAKRRFKEQQARERLPVSADAQDNWDDLLPLLDQELSRLPDKFRAPVVLCDLQGRSRVEAARQLGWTVGTLSWRLAAARKTLAAKLSRRGIALSAGAVLALGQHASACVPGALVAGTTRAALVLAAGPTAAAVGVISAKVLTLTEGVLKTMFLAKITSVPAVFVGVAALGLTTGGLCYQTQAGTGEPGQEREVKAAANAEPQREQPGRRGPETDRAAQEVRESLEQARNRERTLQLALEKMRRELEKVQSELQDARKMAEIAVQRTQGFDRGGRGFGQGGRGFDRGGSPDQPPARNPSRGAARGRGPDDRPQPGPGPGGDGGPQPRPGPAAGGAPQGMRGPQPGQGPRPPAGMDPEEAAELRRIGLRRRALEDEMKKLDEQQAQVEKRFNLRREEMQRERAGGWQSGNAPAGDRFDQLLERLTNIERRLQQLEQNRPANRRD